MGVQGTAGSIGTDAGCGFEGLRKNTCSGRRPSEAPVVTQTSLDSRKELGELFPIYLSTAQRVRGATTVGALHAQNPPFQPSSAMISPNTR